MRKTIFKIQGSYYFLTGIWPVLHLSSFMVLTGPKTDLWLVQMVGLLSASIGIMLFFNAGKKMALLSLCAALSYLLIDCVYVVKEVISPIYLLDAGLQLFFIAVITWMVIRK